MKKKATIQKVEHTHLFTPICKYYVYVGNKFQTMCDTRQEAKDYIEIMGWVLDETE